MYRYHSAFSALGRGGGGGGVTDEHDALIRNRTWYFIPRDSTPNIVGRKRVFRTKFNLNGIVDCLKGRLVAKGFHQ